MAEPFLSEIRIVSFGFAPKGWALCNGQLLPINQNQALFSLLGTTYGGDGQVTFALPDLRDRVPIHFGQGLGLSPRQLGLKSGFGSHTLSAPELPAHTHALQVSSAFATQTSPAGRYPARNPAGYPQYGSTADVAMAPAISSVGDSQPHDNRQPFLGLKFVIALQGSFPSQF
jgi:microcystin-dependent protein